MKTVAIITNYNISEKLAAAMKTADVIIPYVEKILIPVAYNEENLWEIANSPLAAVPKTAATTVLSTVFTSHHDIVLGTRGTE